VTGDTPRDEAAKKPEILDWAAFSARDFPGCHRHDLIAVTAYAAYRRDSAAGFSAAKLLGSKR
jgi:hypothetical protein